MGVIGAGQVVEVVSALGGAGVTVWVDGGWGVDALLGKQTRKHDDLDLVVPIDRVPVVRGVLTTWGFTVERNWLPTALALWHPDGRALDLHPVEPAQDGGGEQVQLDGSRWYYSAPVTGYIDEQPVLCCSPECQLAAHLGYEPDRTDRVDMALLAQRFGLHLPASYQTG